MLKAPFPYFGGKRRAAELVWSRFGDVPNYIEPFAGSAAMLLCRPTEARIETLNNLDCFVANFWRATSREPETVAEYADWPVNEADLHARHRFLVRGEAAADFRRRMRDDSDFYDCRFAGWWCWGLCCWIGSGWCSTSNEGAAAEWSQRPDLAGFNGEGAKGDLRGVHAKRPRANSQAGRDTGGALPGVHAPTLKVPRAPRANGSQTGGQSEGVHLEKLPQSSPRLTVLSENITAGSMPRSMPRSNGGKNGSLGVNLDIDRRPQLADEFSPGRGVNANGGAATCRERREWLIEWFSSLRDRLRTVRVCCGDWLRVCNSPSVTTRLGITGVFLDPPYSTEAGRDMNLYGHESGTVAHQVREYCLERGADPRMRLALCGYAGEGHEELEAHGWSVVAWKSPGGYGNRTQKGRANAGKERIWFSPHCVQTAVERLLF